MRVEREAAQEQQEPAKCKYGGAMVGDTIIFSSHNPMNEDLPYYVLTNKPYVVQGMTFYTDGGAVGHMIDEEGDVCTVDVGSYDIIRAWREIIKAEQKPVEAPFRPVHVILESEEEVKDFIYQSEYSDYSLGIVDEIACVLRSGLQAVRCME